jgi:hypothetical protein
MKDWGSEAGGQEKEGAAVGSGAIVAAPEPERVPGRSPLSP